MTQASSAYRQFLGAGDVWALKQIHESIIPLIENGEALAAAEFKAQFPNCPWYYHYTWLASEMPEETLYDERNKAQIAAVEVLLTEIVAKISADPCAISTDPFANGEATLDATKQVVESLRQLFAPKEGEVIRTGLHFPLGIMQKIVEVHNDQYSLWSHYQLAYFSRTVIGAAEAALTAVDGQCYKNGIPDLYIDLGPDRRDGLFCRQPLGLPSTLTPLVGRLGNTVFVDPSNGESCILSSDPGYFAGFFYWYNKHGQGLPQVRGDGSGHAVRELSVLCQALREIKANAIRAIMRQCEEKSTICFAAFDRPMQCVMF